jgi:MinD superfamily P-loop ATPase
VFDFSCETGHLARAKEKRSDQAVPQGRRLGRGARSSRILLSQTDESSQDVDVLIVDCPPGTTDEHLSIATSAIRQFKYHFA